MGRLANVMSCYGYLYGVARKYDVRPILSDSMKAKLSTLFPGLTIPSFSDLNCDNGQKIFQPILGIHDALNRLSQSDSFPIHILPTTLIGSTFRYAYLRELRHKDFKINAHIVQVVQEGLNRVKRVFLERQESISEVLFAGLHARRTDFEEKVVRERGGHPINETYFFRAMDEFRRRFGPYIVFVFASDDPKWVKDSFFHLPDVFFASDLDRKHINPAFFDFALLANCNHTIQR
ncbi:hypothetical protein TCAL_14165 [Tigriopus californicus]|uniref:L-Fucosyltransferase n=1 Tax=Tigriopus californicus TaxID=6832 RepID=A0A553NEJ8_TIGCA|nr:hypothetical protein TCAL_14165 [Tigriopus californicus]|eukprot:TCALIF_14165-PA protein Name:"Similar to FUT1 Galactoside 2-alpha-L-fucosyltransferase 1 (Saimiri sciureus)" AED:0.04 eAED:0.06 QI:0/-1/0/1/-1/1/1/0/233